MSLVASIFQESDFDLNQDGTYVQELSMLRHKYQIMAIGMSITIGKKHFALDRLDGSGGDIAGWWYREIQGNGSVLIIND